ncbi:MAG: ribosomal RNA small subunit methyltransferase A [Nitrospirae bacterium]|nr:ribosomal RNA small subunit methyltransferase A [Nitrospirota bacterium]
MAKKHLGQNFLFDPSILARIIEVSGLTADDLVVEVGPGHGRLTKMLAMAARQVIAIELDRDLHKALLSELRDFSNIELIEGDVLEFPFETLDKFKAIANIPYYITTPIIFRLLETATNLESMTLTIQKEVAERIVAKPCTKDYGVLSLAVQYYGEPEIKFLIPKGAFKPTPKVDSAVLNVKKLAVPRVAAKDKKFFFKVVRTAFAQRRKTLSNSLKPLQKENLLPVLEALGIDAKRRPETLTIEEFAMIADAL